MKTKLVYVLTCAPEATYIEQALMAIWSARYNNPDAYIVLLTDNLTNGLLVGTRGELLEYISDKIVIQFDDDKSMLYRSRWIKTKARELVCGDFLFVDSDTICCKALNEIDDFACEIGAVGDNNMLFQDDLYKKDTALQVKPLCDISNETYYFSSGVIFSRDTPIAHKLFSLWHRYWLEGVNNFGISIDQPALAKANIELKHVIIPIDNKYNCVLYTQNKDIVESVILHLSGKTRTTFLLSDEVLNKLREGGLTDWIKDCIINIHSTYLPFDYHIKHSSNRQRLKWLRDISHSADIYRKYVNRQYSDWDFNIAPVRLVVYLYQHGMYNLGTIVWLTWKICLLKRKNIPSNFCASQ